MWINFPFVSVPRIAHVNYWCNLDYFFQVPVSGQHGETWLSPTIMDASTLMDWRNAVIAIDLKRISAILSINQTVLSASLNDIPSDIQIPVKLGSPSEMSALQYTLLTMWSYNTSMSPNEKQLTKARKQLVDLLLQVRPYLKSSITLVSSQRKNIISQKKPPPPSILKPLSNCLSR
jgi:hypothetical protein